MCAREFKTSIDLRLEYFATFWLGFKSFMTS